MINDYDNHWIPSEGYKYLSNGTCWTDSIFLGAKDSIGNWHDTNEEPPEPPEPEPDDEATEADYQAALNAMGVSTQDEA